MLYQKSSIKENPVQVYVPSNNTPAKIQERVKHYHEGVKNMKSRKTKKRKKYSPLLIQGVVSKKILQQIKVYLISNKHIPIDSQSEPIELIKLLAKVKFNEDDIYDIQNWITLHRNDFIGWPGAVKGIKTPHTKKEKKKKNKPNFTPEYVKYIESSEWKKITNVVKTRDNNMCTNCGGDYILHVHHLSYKNLYNEMEHLEDLVTLCQECHEKIHKRKFRK